MESGSMNTFLLLQYVRKQFISNTELEKKSAAYFLNFDTFATFRKLYLFISPPFFIDWNPNIFVS